MSELLKRIITSVILIAILLMVFWLDGLWLYGFLALVYLLALQESFVIWRKAKSFLVLLYILAMSGAFYAIYILLAHDRHYFYLLVLLMMTTDVMAFICGKNVPIAKLAPKISAGKSWGGLMGAVFSSANVALLVHFYLLDLSSPIFALIIGALIALSGQMSDLCESYCKRLAGVKDSGWILPGHGGVLDRIDGYMLSAPILLLLLHFIS